MPTCYIHDNGHRKTLPLPSGASWWGYELTRRCTGSPDAPATQQLSYATTPPHGGDRTWSAACTRPRCTRHDEWRASGRPEKYAQGSSLRTLYGPHSPGYDPDLAAAAIAAVAATAPAGDSADSSTAAARRPALPQHRWPLFAVVTFNDGLEPPQAPDPAAGALNCTLARASGGALQLVELRSEEVGGPARMRAIRRFLANEPALQPDSIVAYLAHRDAVMLASQQEVRRTGGAGRRAQGSGFRVQGSGFRVRA